jgi:hypothetical protein
VDIVWEVMMYRWKAQRFLLGPGENHRTESRRRSGLSRQ